MSRESPDGLGEDPLAQDPLLETLYDLRPAGKRRRPGNRDRQPLKDGQTWRLVTFSFYESDVQRLDALLEDARRRGVRRPSRSQIVRLALRQVDLSALDDSV